MNNVFVLRRKQKIDSLFGLAKELGANSELLSHWAKYLCVLVCGLLETSIVELYRQYPVGRSSKEMIRYIGYSLNKLPNPRLENIVVLANMFSQDWGNELNAIQSSEVGLAITSVVSNRINIAHGRDSSVSMHDITQWYPRIIEFIEMVETQCSR